MQLYTYLLYIMLHLHVWRRIMCCVRFFFFYRKLTVEYVNYGIGGKRIARRARVIAGMGARRAFDVQSTVLVRQVGRNVNTSVDVIVDHPAVVIPEYVHGVHGTLANHAFQMQRTV